MLSTETLLRLEHAVTDRGTAAEINRRLISSAPGSAGAAATLLATLSSARNAAISERLTIALAGDDRGAAGRELAKKINGMVAVIAAQANGNEVPAVAATASLNLTNDIALTSVAAGAARNTNTLTLQVLAAAANPTDTVLVDVTGTAAAIVVTVTPNDGTNNGATPVDLTTAELAELINTGDVVAKNVTLTDAGGLLNDQTATGGGAQALADGGEGDGVVATFSGGVNATDADTAPAQAAMGSEHMSAGTFECLVHALGSRPAAMELRSAYNTMVDEVQSI